MLQHFPPTGQWTDEMRKIFVDLKSALISTPALDLLDYTQPFYLCATEKEGLASSFWSRNMGIVRWYIIRQRSPSTLSNIN